MPVSIEVLYQWKQVLTHLTGYSRLPPPKNVQASYSSEVNMPEAMW